ncbi:MAG: Hsp33 family molecular chaperone HslO [Piscirickettsiaceae bacterium]|nr:MAG: Hsp33 family molecular chaperone HslO [Piscirickettsiaceae bacterium]PCI71476.1 MAG: Hsp33 family molecular chaperone HslO [Piscirickettsiaceae bacterium]
MNHNKDQLFRFLFDELGVRGEIVSLDTSFQAALELHDYPTIVAEQLGQALAASLLLSATLKFDGSLIMQIRGNGPISMLVAQADNKQAVRGLAHWNGDVPDANLATLFGDGVLVMTIKPTKGKAYQGVVSLEGNSLADALQAYFTQSEQLKTRLWFAVNNERAVGLMLQELPEHDGKQMDWERVEILANTITDDELLSLDSEDIIHRLFHGESIRAFEPQPVEFKCDCSREKVEASLLTLGQKELRSLLEEKGIIEADCDFCNKHYQFDKVDIEQLLNEGKSGGSTVQH